MLQAKKELLSYTWKELAKYSRVTDRTIAEKLKFEVWLQYAFYHLLPVGEIGELSPSVKKESLSYILYLRRSFCVIPRDSIVQLALHPLDSCLEVFRIRNDAIIAETFTGFLNNILDVILKGNQTIFDLREKQKMKPDPETTEGKKKALYQIISEAAADEALPDDFSLPKNANDFRVTWEDQYGILLKDGQYDFTFNQLSNEGEQQITEDQKALIAFAIDCAGAGQFNQAETLFYELVKTIPAISIRDLILEYIINNREKPGQRGQKNLHTFALILALTSANTECVKICLTFFLIFTPDEVTKKMVRTLALSDEFALFGMFYMSLWENGNQEIFKAAKKVHGWGRINAIELLKPDTEEIRKWILTDGIKNNVEESYSALTCWKKSGSEDLLKGNTKLSREDLSCIRDIISALFDDSEYPFISVLPRRDTVIMKFLDHLAQENLTSEDRGVICTISDYYNYSGGDDSYPGVIERCRKLLNSQNPGR